MGEARSGDCGRVGPEQTDRRGGADRAGPVRFRSHAFEKYLLFCSVLRSDCDVFVRRGEATTVMGRLPAATPHLWGEGVCGLT